MIQIERIIKCSMILERIVSDFYIELSSKINNPRIKSRLMYIGYDSYKHHQLLSKFVSSNELPSMEECSESFGYVFKQVINSLDILNKKYPSEDEVLRLIEDMIRFESSVGEELFGRLIYTMLAKSEYANKNELLETLNLLSLDEERHKELLLDLLPR